MTSLRRAAPALLAGLVVAALPAAAVAWAGVGEPAAGFTLRDAAGRQHRLEDHRGKVVVLVAWSSGCEDSQRYARRLARLAKRTADAGGVVLGLAPSTCDTAEAVDAAAKRHGLGFPVLLDPNGRVARALGAVVTPTAWVVDGGGVVRYQGAIDSDPGGGRQGATEFLREAVEAVLAGKAPPRPETRPVGTSIR